MGKIQVGQQVFEDKNIEIQGNILLLKDNQMQVPLCRPGTRVQLRGTQVLVDKVVVDNTAFIEGNVNSITCGNVCYILGKFKGITMNPQTSLYMLNREDLSKIFKQTSDSFVSKQPGEDRRKIIKISGDFSSIVTSTCGVCMGLEVWLDAKVNSVVASNCVYVKGNVFQASAGNVMQVLRQ